MIIYIYISIIAITISIILLIYRLYRNKEMFSMTTSTSTSIPAIIMSYWNKYMHFADKRSKCIDCDNSSNLKHPQKCFDCEKEETANNIMNEENSDKLNEIMMSSVIKN